MTEYTLDMKIINYLKNGNIDEAKDMIIHLTNHLYLNENTSREDADIFDLFIANEGEQLLIQSIEADNLIAVKNLVRFGVDIHFNGEEPLDTAAYKTSDDNNIAIAEFLLDECNGDFAIDSNVRETVESMGNPYMIELFMNKSNMQFDRSYYE